MSSRAQLDMLPPLDEVAHVESWPAALSLAGEATMQLGCTPPPPPPFLRRVAPS